MVTVSAQRPQRGIPGSDHTGAGINLRLLGGFELLSDGVAVTLPMSAQRLMVFLALRGRPVGRLHVAGVLWADSPEQRAVANLRCAVWRLHRAGLRLISTEPGQIGLHPSVDVDLHRAEDMARRFLRAAVDPPVGPLDPDWELLAAELLPDWTDDWVLVEREYHRQMGLEALENLAERLLQEGRTKSALELAFAIVAQEPLRESAHRVAVRIFLNEGNTYNALRQYRLYESLARRHLGVAPSELMERLVNPLQGAVGAA